MGTQVTSSPCWCCRALSLGGPRLLAESGTGDGDGDGKSRGRPGLLPGAGLARAVGAGSFAQSLQCSEAWRGHRLPADLWTGTVCPHGCGLGRSHTFQLCFREAVKPWGASWGDPCTVGRLFRRTQT